MALYSSYKPTAGVTSLHAGTDTAVSTSTGPVTVWNTGTLQTITDRGFTTTNKISISNTTSALSTITGALTVAGGAGIGGDLYIGGTEYIKKTNITALTDSVSTWFYDSSYTPTLTSFDITFKPDGTKMFVPTANAIQQYTLGTPWSFASVTSGTTYSLAAVDTGVNGLTFSPDGTKMVTVGTTAVVNATVGSLAGEDRAYYFTLSSPWDPTSATLVSSIRFAINDQGLPAAETAPQACAYDATGSNFYMLGSTGDKVYQYTLSSPYVISTSTAVYSKQFSVAGEDGGGTGLAFNYAGTRMYMVAQTFDTVFEYRLGTPWDISTSVFYDKFLVANQSGAMNGIYVNDTATNYAFTFGTTSIYRYRTDTQATQINPETTSSAVILYGNTRVKNNNLTVDSNIYAFGSTGITLYTPNITAGQSAASGGIFTAISSGNLSLYTGQTSGIFTLGGAVGTGAITLGQSTSTQTINLGTGVAATGTFKTINIGTAGVLSSTSTINIGPAIGTGTVLVGTGTTVVINNITSATSTATGALRVLGGVGIAGSLYATALYDSGYRVLTTATSVVNSIIAGSDISVSAATGNVTVSDISTLQSVTNRGSTTTNIVYITNTSTSNATTSGALIVSGGVGIGGNVNSYGTVQAGTQILVKANSLDNLNSSTVVVESTVPVGYSAFTIKNSGTSGQSYTFDLGGNNRALGGGTAINEGNLIIRDDTNNANRMVITKTGNILVNTSTDTGAKLQINGSVSIQGSLQETRVTLVNNTSATVVDSFVSSVYRSCKCLVQVQDGNEFHITEIVLLHDNSGQVYKSEYGIISTGGERGSFTADLQGDGIVRLYFAADNPSSKTVSIVKTAIAV